MGMDDDLQTHPSQMYKLLDKAQEGYDLVYGNYAKRKNSFLKNLTSKFNKVTSRILLGRPKDIVSSNYWVITKLVRDEVIKYTNYNPYIDAIFYRVTSNIADVTIEHHQREQGSSNYTFRKLVKLWMAYWNFSVIPCASPPCWGYFSPQPDLWGLSLLSSVSCLTPARRQAGHLSCAPSFFVLWLRASGAGNHGEYLGKIMLCINNTPSILSMKP